MRILYNIKKSKITVTINNIFNNHKKTFIYLKTLLIKTLSKIMQIKQLFIEAIQLRIIKAQDRYKIITRVKFINRIII